MKDTYCKLECFGPDEDVDAFNDTLLDLTEDDDVYYDEDVEALIRGEYAGPILSDLIDWITAAAEKYPTVLVCLIGDEGQWERRWKGKETKFHCASIPPFTNPNLLHDYEKNNN